MVAFLYYQELIFHYVSQVFYIIYNFQIEREKKYPKLTNTLTIVAGAGDSQSDLNKGMLNDQLVEANLRALLAPST